MRQKSSLTIFLKDEKITINLHDLPHTPYLPTCPWICHWLSARHSRGRPEENIDEEILYSILNQSKQLDSYVVINSILPIRDIKFELKDLKSRAESFVNLGIELPTDDLLRVIISKSFSDKQIEITPKISEYIIKNIERSYEKVFKFIKEIDDLSLSSGKSININLIKKVLIDE